jgi:hypothetical protein
MTLDSKLAPTTTDPTPPLDLSDLSLLPIDREKVDFEPNQSEIKAVLTALIKSRGKIGSFAKPERALAARLGQLLHGESSKHHQETRWIQVATVMAHAGLIQAVVDPQGQIRQIRLNSEEEISEDEGEIDEPTDDSPTVAILVNQLSAMACLAARKSDDETLDWAQTEVDKANSARNAAADRAETAEAQVKILEARPDGSEEIAGLKVRLADSERARRAAESKRDGLQIDLDRERRNNDRLSGRVAEQQERVAELQTTVDAIKSALKIPNMDNATIVEVISRAVEDVQQTARAEFYTGLMNFLEQMRFDRMRTLLEMFFTDDDDQLGGQIRAAHNQITILNDELSRLSKKSVRKYNSMLRQIQEAEERLDKLVEGVIGQVPEQTT